MATNPKQPSTKSVGNPCVASFTFRGQKYVVEMIDPLIERNKNGGLKIPQFNGGRYSGGHWVKTKKGSQRVDMVHTPATWGISYLLPDAKNPDKVLNGFYCPATFRVTGYLYDMTFTTGVKDAPRLSDGQNNSRVVIYSITIQSQAGKDTDPVTRELIGRIPVALLLESALKVCQFTGRYTDQYSPIPNFEIIKLGYQLTIKDVDNFLGRKRRGQPKADDTSLSDKSLALFAKLWHACPADYPGGKDAYIANNMVMADGSPMYGVSQRNRQLRRARDEKRIPQVPKKYNYKRNPTKRVKK